MKKILFLFLINLSALAYAQNRYSPMYSAPHAEEYQVEFQFIFRTEWQDLGKLRKLNNRDRLEYKNQYILPTLKYLYGPLNNRAFGNPQRNFDVQVDWAQAKVLQGWVVLPYTYKAQWIIANELTGYNQISVPVPYTAANLETPNWVQCTDSEVTHQTMNLYWYYWDPARPGCDQKEGVHYQNIVITLQKKTPNLKVSYPEYQNLIQVKPGGKILTLTFAFGYVEEVTNPLPDQDLDYGMQQYRDFLSYVRKNSGSVLKETPIYQSEFPGAVNPRKIMGYRFIGYNSGVHLKIDVMAAADVDQMDIFAKSFAHDHDSFFGWFGHSRLGWGFDSDNLVYYLKRQPQYYSISQQYQIIYWAGCNSYSYYTIPFFELKANSQQDPFGTKYLDIISNGLSSYFALNSTNAKIVLRHLINWEKRASYQVILSDLEFAAHRIGADRIMINVLGDEDNSP